MLVLCQRQGVVELTCNILLVKSASSAMLPMLLRRCAYCWGSSLGSVVELVSDFPPVTKPLTAALRLCSSSIAWFLLRLRKKTARPIMAARAMTPTTTPTAMPTLDVPPPLLCCELEVALAVGVATTVVPALTVTTDGFADVVDDGVDAEDELELPPLTPSGAPIPER